VVYIPTVCQREQTNCKKTEALLFASKLAGGNVYKTKYTVMSHDQNAERSHNIKMDNNYLESLEAFKYLEITVTNHNSIKGETKKRLNSGNTCYHSVQNLLSSSLLPNNLKKRYTEL
jgi:hypothetical protein